MLVKSQKKDKQSIMYNNEPLEYVESFKYLGLKMEEVSLRTRKAPCRFPTREYGLLTEEGELDCFEEAMIEAHNKE